MPQMVLARTFVMATTKGHIIGFIKDKPTHVPDVCIPDAVAIGAQMADGSKADPLPADAPMTRNGPDDPNKREQDILAAIGLLVEQNSRKDFTAAGLPATEALERVLGYDITAAERNAMWQLHCDKKASGTEE